MTNWNSNTLMQWFRLRINQCTMFMYIFIYIMCVFTYIYIYVNVYAIEWTIHRVLSAIHFAYYLKGVLEIGHSVSSIMLKPCVQTNRSIGAVAKLTKIFPLPCAWVDRKWACVYVHVWEPAHPPPSPFRVFVCECI